MGKSKNYSDELMLEAVEQYANLNPEKRIKRTELAAWANENIAELEGVHDYDFARYVKVIKNGKEIRIDRPCTSRINAINEARAGLMFKKNYILHSSGPDEFLDLPDLVKRKMVLDARKEFAKIFSKNEDLTIQIRKSEAEKCSMEKEVSLLKGRVDEALKTQEVLAKMLKFYLAKIREYEHLGKLEEIGITNEGVELKKLYDSADGYLKNPNLDVIISRHLSGEVETERGGFKKEDYINMALDGLDLTDENE